MKCEHKFHCNGIDTYCLKCGESEEGALALDSVDALEAENESLRKQLAEAKEENDIRKSEEEGYLKTINELVEQIKALKAEVEHLVGKVNNRDCDIENTSLRELAGELVDCLTHADMCQSLLVIDVPCTCGLSELLAQAKEMGIS
jgi:regulator of replication initiation timing